MSETTTSPGKDPTPNGAVERPPGTGPVHLLPADRLLVERYRGRMQLLTLCGRAMAEFELPHVTCPDEKCECELSYCPDCLSSATKWNAEWPPAVSGS
jgi:hypothetical protein